MNTERDFALLATFFVMRTDCVMEMVQSHSEWLYDIRGAGLDDFILPDMYYVYYYYASEINRMMVTEENAGRAESGSLEAGRQCWSWTFRQQKTSPFSTA